MSINGLLKKDKNSKLISFNRDKVRELADLLGIPAHLMDALISANTSSEVAGESAGAMITIGAEELREKINDFSVTYTSSILG